MLSETTSTDTAAAENNAYLARLGPIAPFLEDESVSEIMVNGPGVVCVERKGKIERTGASFRDDEHLIATIRFIVESVGRRIDNDSPLCDARLADGSRVNAIIPPLALDGALLTIRKFSSNPLQVEDLVRSGTLTPVAAAFLEACVLARYNIIVSGGTGTGKTTLLNVLSSFIPDDERIVTIEDAAELQLRQWHVCRLESRPADIDGRGHVPIRQLVVNSLRMRPDRIVVGECRSGEALDMLQAMNTGHDGSLTTLHANTPRDALSRLETLVLMAGVDLPLQAIRRQMASAIDMVVQLTRLRDGSRRLTHVTEVTGMEGDTLTLQDIFTFEAMGADENGRVQGDFKSTGNRPEVLERLQAVGIPVPPELSEIFPERPTASSVW
jgi:pilus assembly protein CpaF